MLSRFSDLTFRRAPPPGPSHLDPLVSQAHADALVRAFVSWKYPRQIIVKGEYIVSVKVDDRGFIVHKWTKKIVDLKQVYLVVKDNRRIYQLALEFNQRPGEKKAFTDVLQFDPPQLHAAHLEHAKGAPGRGARLGRRRRPLLLLLRAPPIHG